MKTSKAYWVEYRMYQHSETKGVMVTATNKEEARYKALYDVIPSLESHSPYCLWVASVTYQNGNYKRF